MIIVTGASRGLGKAICERLISKNIEIIGLARDISDISFKSYNCDITNYDQIKNLAKIFKSQNLKISGLINVAGIASMNLTITTPRSTVEKIINTNLLGTIYCCQLFSPLMIRNKAGSIINFSTIAVDIGLKGESIYVASKAGVEGFSKSLAREMADFNINVNCIAPGPINTDLLRGVSPAQIENIINSQIIKKQFHKDDICDLIEILIDKKSQSLSGQIFNVGGV